MAACSGPRETAQGSGHCVANGSPVRWHRWSVFLIGLSDQSMEIIDHNLAFDDLWSSDAFFANHVFAGIRTGIAPPKLLAMRERLREARGRVDALWSEVPDSWRFIDYDMAAPAGLTRERICCILDRVENEWEGSWL